MSDYSREALSKGVMYVSRHSVALFHHSSVMTLDGETGHLNREHRLIGEHLRELLFFGAKCAFSRKANPNQAFFFAGDDHWNGKHSNDSKRQKMRAPGEFGIYPYVFEHHRSLYSKHLGPSGNCLHCQRRADGGKLRLVFSLEHSIFKGELKNHQATDGVPQPDAATMRVELCGNGSQHVFNGSARVGFSRQRGRRKGE